MGRYTERQQAVINLLRLYISFWRNQHHLERVELQTAVTEFCEAGYPEEFVREEILPLLFPYSTGAHSSDSTSDDTSSSDSSNSDSVSTTSSSSDTSTSTLSSDSTSSSSSSSSFSSSSSTSSLNDHHTSCTDIIWRQQRRRRHWDMRLHRLQISSPSSSDDTESSIGSISEGELADSEMDGDDGDDWDMAEKQAEYVMTCIERLYSRRYLRPRNLYRRPPGHLRHVLDVWKANQPDQFRENLRVTPKTFGELVADIEDDLVFMNSSQNEQIPVSDQLAITLYRFGHFGNGANLQQVANWSGYSKGLAVHPLTTEEKEEAKGWIESHLCKAWRNGYCMVDGTLVVLAERPYWFGESYFDQKCNYSLNFQVCTVYHSPSLCQAC
ncbi:hypothetical protein EV361DRAFT_553322 [Lentinula raphanica]|nr:hypothetical protein EV361DRAFT_553322 [Lentinula raphanica]